MFKKKVIPFLLSAFMMISALASSQITVKAAVLNGWQLNGTTWNYYINGNKATGWIAHNGKWYYLKSNGDMATGWIAHNGKWYYSKSNGDMATGWIAHNGKWYYLKSNGDMATGWIAHNGKWYYLKPNGDMAANMKTPDGYVVRYNGAWDGKAKTYK